jgi:hypothetical protein
MLVGDPLISPFEYDRLAAGFDDVCRIRTRNGEIPAMFSSLGERNPTSGRRDTRARNAFRCCNAVGRHRGEPAGTGAAMEAPHSTWVPDRQRANRSRSGTQAWFCEGLPS